MVRKGCDGIYRILLCPHNTSLAYDDGFYDLFQALVSCREMPKRQLGSEAQAEVDQLPLKMVKLVNMDASPRKDRSISRSSDLVKFSIFHQQT